MLCRFCKPCIQPTTWFAQAEIHSNGVLPICWKKFTVSELKWLKCVGLIMVLLVCRLTGSWWHLGCEARNPETEGCALFQLSLPDPSKAHGRVGPPLSNDLLRGIVVLSVFLQLNPGTSICWHVDLNVSLQLSFVQSQRHSLNFMKYPPILPPTLRSYFLSIAETPLCLA